MKVLIENVKGVGRLEFEIPGSGVWVLTGLNGSGKSTLLAALYRIRNPYAFQQYFQTSPLVNRVDVYGDASVTYEINGHSVSYRYGGQRWRATPRRNSGLINSFPFPAVAYLDANSDRIEPFSDEIRHERFRDANGSMRSFMQNVLGDAKWADLKYLNTQRGRGSRAYLIPYRPHAQAQIHYYSEKSFSLGELCILRLAQRISEVRNGSLLLIDEIEMALHPQAQVRLLENLNRLAEEKRLIVLFSTHSASIIKSAKRTQLMLLKELPNHSIQVTKSPYPAQVLGEVAFDDELNVDFVFFVEDKQAKILLEQQIQRYLQVTYTEQRFQPLFKIVPVGGFVQVLELLNSSSQIFPAHVKKFALLDEDVKTESLASARRGGNQQLLGLFNRSARQLGYLPCTPECGIIEVIEGALMGEHLRAGFVGHVINLERIVGSGDYQALTSNNPREQAKRRVKHLIEKIIESTGIDSNQIYRILYNTYVEYRYGNAIGDLRQLLGPMFNAR